MELTHETYGGVLILRPKSRIDSASARAFEERCLALIAGGPAKVVLDFSELDYISSAGLRVLLVTAKNAQALGGALTLCGLHGNVLEVIQVTGFDTLLGAHPGLAEASAALGVSDGSVKR